MVNGVRCRIERAVRAIGIERCALISIGLIVCLFFAEMRVLDEYLRLNRATGSRGSYDVTILVLDALEALTLSLLYVSLSMSAFPRTVRAALIVSAIAMYAFAISTTIVPTSDLYAYIAYAKLGWQAYSPPNVPFTGPFAMLNAEIARAWGTLDPAPYGPLFVAIGRLVAGPAASVMEAIVAFRFLALAALAVCVVALRALGFGTPLLAVVALDPEIVGNYVLGAHNDVLALAAVLAAMALSKRSRVAAIVCAVAAGSIKAPYALVALLVSVNEASLVRRVGFAAIIAAGTVAVSAIGGLPYLQALTWHASDRTHVLDDFRLLTALHGLAAAAAIAAIAAAVIFRRTLFNAVWTFPTLAPQALRWYAALGIPYAVVERRHAAIYFTTFPLTAYLLKEYETHPYPHLVALAMIFGIALFARKKDRRADELGFNPSRVAP